jgi:hypothetical protein
MMAIATCRQSRNKLRFRPMVLHMPAMVRNGQPGEKHKRIFYGLRLIDRYAEWKSGGAKGCLAIDPRGDIHGKGEL